MPHPIPPLEYFSSEDAPLLSDYPETVHLDVHHSHHGADFEVATFPATPLLPDVTGVHDDDFSDFVQSPTSETPPKLRGTQEDKMLSETKLTDMFALEYIQHIAIIILVQLFIPIPFMVPMGINFVKRALKVFLPGFAIGLLGHAFVNLLCALPNAKLLEPPSVHHLAKHLPDASIFLPTLFSQLKVVMLGDVVVGAVMAHVLNFFILGYTICRLIRRLEPDPTVMRRAMDSSKIYQRAQPVMLDLITAVFMIPAGQAARARLFAFWGPSPSNTDIITWHSALVGVMGVAAVHILRLARRWWSSASIPGSEQAEKLSGKRKDLIKF